MDEEKKPSYRVGISTGFWRIGKDPALLGLAQKIGGLGATGGIRFVQVDLETVAEFYEPDLKDLIRRMKDKLDMTAGLHGEIGELMALDSAEKRIWDQTHTRLCQTVRYAHELGFFYVNIHLSNKQLISFTESQHRIQGYFYPVVGPNGKGLQEIVRGNPQTEAETSKHLYDAIVLRSQTGEEEQRKLIEQIEKAYEKRSEEEYQRFLQENPGINEDQKKLAKQQIEGRNAELANREINRRARSPEFVAEIWLKLKEDEFERYVLQDGEWGAYHIVARWMKEKNDYFWNTIARGQVPASSYQFYENEFCAAVASKYIEGHLTLKDHKANIEHLNGMSVKEWCEKNNLLLLLENPESGEGAEGLYRLFDPRHFYYTIKHLNSPSIKITIDFEHMVSQQINPDEILPKLPSDFGKMIVLFHLGQPVPYGGTAHIPVARGSLAQEQIYRWLHQLRKKGWNKGYIMFERGGGRTGQGRLPSEVFEDSVQALRQIAKYLDLDVRPEQLPPEFFGISVENKAVFARQVVTMREHAWDPLEGVLSVPEEKHTFLGKAAVDKGKAQEWEKRKFR